MPIDKALAKAELVKINDALPSPHLLIGGLAVEQYYKGRNSKDIDLVCSHDVALALLAMLYKSNEWDIEDKNDDEYRPSYVITHQIEDGICITFGPKITERESYDYVNWGEFKADARCFEYKNQKFENILVPSADSLAFSKMVAAVARKSKLPEKALQDFRDFVDLCNHKTFNINKFVRLLKRARLSHEFVRSLCLTVEEHREVWEICNLKYLFDVVVQGRPHDPDVAEKILDVRRIGDSYFVGGGLPISSFFSETNAESKADLIARINSASREFVAFGLTRNFYADKISDLLLERAREIQVKLFLMNPDCASRVDRYRIEPIEAAFENPDRFKRMVIEKYRRLLKKAASRATAGSLQVFLYDFPCSFSMEKLDDSIRVMLYGHGVRGTDGPIFVFDKKGKYFDYFDSQLNWLVRMGEEQIYDEARGAGPLCVQKLTPAN